MSWKDFKQWDGDIYRRISLEFNHEGVVELADCIIKSAANKKNVNLVKRERKYWAYVDPDGNRHVLDGPESVCECCNAPAPEGAELEVYGGDRLLDESQKQVQLPHWSVYNQAGELVLETSDKAQALEMVSDSEESLTVEQTDQIQFVESVETMPVVDEESCIQCQSLVQEHQMCPSCDKLSEMNVFGSCVSCNTKTKSTGDLNRWCGSCNQYVEYNVTENRLVQESDLAHKRRITQREYNPDNGRFQVMGTQLEDVTPLQGNVGDGHRFVATRLLPQDFMSNYMVERSYDVVPKYGKDAAIKSRLYNIAKHLHDNQQVAVIKDANVDEDGNRHGLVFGSGFKEWVGFLDGWVDEKHGKFKLSLNVAKQEVKPIYMETSFLED